MRRHLKIKNYRRFDHLSMDDLVSLARKSGIPATDRWKRETIISKLREQGA